MGRLDNSYYADDPYGMIVKDFFDRYDLNDELNEIVSTDEIKAMVKKEWNNTITLTNVVLNYVPKMIRDGLISQAKDEIYWPLERFNDLFMYYVGMYCHPRVRNEYDSANNVEENRKKFICKMRQLINEETVKRILIDIRDTFVERFIAFLVNQCLFNDTKASFVSHMVDECKQSFE
ncbi:MAG: hypothetical protein IKN74_01330 [Clostridia bacterium]|nr:hypothetical protein [Clostridia bacterium]